MLSPLKLVVALCAISATAIEFTCYKKTYHKGPVTGVYSLNNRWQNARDCTSAKWNSNTNNRNCVWIRGSKGQKSWSARSKDPPVDIYKDVGWNSQVREAPC